MSDVTEKKRLELPEACLRWSFDGQRARAKSDGAWVKHSDYEEMRSFANGRMCAAKSLEAERDALKARVEELAAQRDAAMIGQTERQRQFEEMGDLADEAVAQRDSAVEWSCAQESKIAALESDLAREKERSVRMRELLDDAIHSVPSGFHKRRLNLRLIEISEAEAR